MNIFKPTPDARPMFSRFAIPAAPSHSAFILLTWSAPITTLAFALSAFACDRLGHKIISPFFAAGAWLFGAFGVLVWYWRFSTVNDQFLTASGRHAGFGP